MALITKITRLLTITTVTTEYHSHIITSSTHLYQLHIISIFIISRLSIDNMPLTRKQLNLYLLDNLPVSKFKFYLVTHRSGKVWFPLNVSVIATNQSCLLVRMMLRFAGFHRQSSFGLFSVLEEGGGGLLRGLLYLEACKSRSASGI